MAIPSYEDYKANAIASSPDLANRPESFWTTAYANVTKGTVKGARGSSPKNVSQRELEQRFIDNGVDPEKAASGAANSFKREKERVFEDSDKERFFEGSNKERGFGDPFEGSNAELQPSNMPQVTDTVSPAPSTTTTTPTTPTNPNQSAIGATVAPAQSTVGYQIQKGDTLSDIAKQTGMSIEQIVALNPKTIKDPNKINAGTSIMLNADAVSKMSDPSTQITRDKNIVNWGNRKDLEDRARKLTSGEAARLGTEATAQAAQNLVAASPKPNSDTRNLDIWKLQGFGG